MTVDAPTHRGGVGRSALSDLFRQSGFRRLFAGQAVSGVGDWMGTVALMALVLDLSGSSAAVAVILVLRLAPAAVAGPLAARIVGRWNSRRTMMTLDAGRAVIVVLIPLIHSLWWVYLWAFLLEGAGLIFLPARDAAVPRLTSGRNLQLANGLMLGSSYGTMPLGAGLFSMTAALVGSQSSRSQLALGIIFVIDAITFLISFDMIRRVGELSRQERSGRQNAGDGGPSFLEALRLPLVRAVAPRTLVAALGLGSLFSLGIVFVRQVLGASTTQFGFLVALFGAGAALGLALVQWGKLSGLYAVRVSLMAQGVIVAGMSLSPSIAPALFGAVAFGAATAATISMAMSLLQTQLTGQKRVMGFAVFHVAIRAGLATAAVLAGAAADLIGGSRWPLVGNLPPTRMVLLLSGLVVVVSALGMRMPARGGEEEPSARSTRRRA